MTSLAGFLESLCIPTAMLIGVPSMLLYTRSRQASEGIKAPPDRLTAAASNDEERATSYVGHAPLSDAQQTAMRVSRGYMLACAAAVVVGITLLVLTFAETVYSIVVLTHYGGGKRFFCDIVGI